MGQERAKTTAAEAVSESGLLRVEDVATRLSMSKNFVYRVLRTGELRGIRIGHDWRVDPADLKAWIDARRVALQSTG